MFTCFMHAMHVMHSIIVMKMSQTLASFPSPVFCFLPFSFFSLQFPHPRRPLDTVRYSQTCTTFAIDPQSLFSPLSFLNSQSSFLFSLFSIFNSQFLSFSFIKHLYFHTPFPPRSIQDTNHKTQIKAFHQATFNMLGAKSTVVLAFFAICARLAAATPPACLLAAVKYSFPPVDDLLMLIFLLVLKTIPPMSLFSAVPILPTSRPRSRSSVVTTYKLR